MLRFGGAVQPEVGVAMQIEEGLQHIQHLGHLGEDEGLVAASLQLIQQLCQLLHSHVVIKFRHLHIWAVMHGRTDQQPDRQAGRQTGRQTGT